MYLKDIIIFICHRGAIDKYTIKPQL